MIVIGAAIKIFWKKIEKFGREAKFFNFFPARPLGHARHTKVRVGKLHAAWLGKRYPNMGAEGCTASATVILVLHIRAFCP